MFAEDLFKVIDILSIPDDVLQSFFYNKTSHEAINHYNNPEWISHFLSNNHKVSYLDWLDKF